MNDDLISRKVVLEYLDKRRTYELMYGRNKAYGKGVLDATKDIEAFPSVLAVPLDKLCEWLSENALNITCRNITPLKTNAEHWKKLITKWMEEQNATD